MAQNIKENVSGSYLSVQVLTRNCLLGSLELQVFERQALQTWKVQCWECVWLGKIWSRRR